MNRGTTGICFLTRLVEPKQHLSYINVLWPNKFDGMEEVHPKNYDLTINDINKFINKLLSYDTNIWKKNKMMM